MRILSGIALALVLSAASHVMAQTSKIHEATVGAAPPIDCTDIKIEYVNNPSLTRDENIALMDQALVRSLSKFDYCQNNQTRTTSAGGNSGGDSAKGTNTAGGGNSVAASDLTGTEQSNTQTAAAKQSSTPTDPASMKPQDAGLLDAKKVEGVGRQTGGGAGKLPDDIPPADNDSILEAQIRQAAILETDPEIKAKLWNEYRKYKGLPLVK